MTQRHGGKIHDNNDALRCKNPRCGHRLAGTEGRHDCHVRCEGCGWWNQLNAGGRVIVPNVHVRLG